MANAAQPGRWRLRLASLLRRAADRLQPEPPRRPTVDPRLGRVRVLPGFQRLDQSAWRDGDVRIRYRATDPVWREGRDGERLVGLREHVRRLCVSAHELSTSPLEGRWGDVAHNLELAHSLSDVFADTGIDESSSWCDPAADYEEANSEVAAKHLAAVIVFTFVWTAYECAVDMMTSGGGGKGALGRHLVAAVAPAHLSQRGETLSQALELDPQGTDHETRDMRRMLERGSVAGMAGEHLRQFRNRSIHGDLPKPEPSDWGDRSEYLADEDPRLLRFRANTRLTLMLLQILAASDVEQGSELEQGVEDACDGRRLLLTLHCLGAADRDEDEEAELDLDDLPAPTFNRMWR